MKWASCCYKKLQVAQTSAKLTPGETKSMEATDQKYGSYSPKSSSFSGSDSIVVEDREENYNFSNGQEINHKA